MPDREVNIVLLTNEDVKYLINNLEESSNNPLLDRETHNKLLDFFVGILDEKSIFEMPEV